MNKGKGSTNAGAGPRKQPAAAAAQLTPDQRAIYDLLKSSPSAEYRAAADTEAGAAFVSTVAGFLPTIRRAYTHVDETQLDVPSVALARKIDPIWTAANRIASAWEKMDTAEKLVVARRGEQFAGWPKRADGETTADFVNRAGEHVRAFVAPFAGKLNPGLEMAADKVKTGVLYVGACPRADIKINLDLDAILYLRAAVVDILGAPAGVTEAGPFVHLAGGFLGLLDDSPKGKRNANVYGKAREAISDAHERFYFRPNRRVND